MLTDAIPDHPRARAIVRYGLYPFSWVALLSGFYLIWTTDRDPRTIWAIIAPLLVTLYLVIEWRLPYQRRWMMTWHSFLADIRFVIVNGAGLWLMRLGLGMATITIAGTLDGPGRDWHPAVQLAACLLTFEAINYVVHRAMHEFPGRFGEFLWRVHVAHHLPAKLYIIMHAAGHPIHSMLVQGLAIILPIWAMGYDPRVVTMFIMINVMHGTISHFNADIRAGWMNYLFIGPELHRYHHSADPAEGKNYGSVLSIFDLMFGTFVYRPGQVPAELGVHPGGGYPAYHKTLALLAFPFSWWWSARKQRQEQ